MDLCETPQFNCREIEAWQFAITNCSLWDIYDLNHSRTLPLISWWLNLINRIACLTVSKPFFQMNKYATTKFIIINRLANWCSDWDKSVHGWRFFSTAKQKWIEYLKIFEISIEEMTHSFFNYFTKIRKNGNWPIIALVKSRAFFKDRGNPC